MSKICDIANAEGSAGVRSVMREREGLAEKVLFEQRPKGGRGMGRTKVWGGHFRQRRCWDSPRVWLERRQGGGCEKRSPRATAGGISAEPFSVSQSPGLQDRIQMSLLWGWNFLIGNVGRHLYQLKSSWKLLYHSVLCQWPGVLTPLGAGHGPQLCHAWHGSR